MPTEIARFFLERTKGEWMDILSAIPEPGSEDCEFDTTFLHVMIGRSLKGPAASVDSLVKIGPFYDLVKIGPFYEREYELLIDICDALEEQAGEMARLNAEYARDR